MILWVVMNIFLFLASYTDPGIIPRKPIFEITHGRQIPFPYNVIEKVLFEFNLTFKHNFKIYRKYFLYFNQYQYI